MILTGRVQGVNFRSFAVREADNLGVKGYIKNLHDGNLEIVAEGNEKELQEFIKKCRRGPLLAFVKGFDVKEENATGEFEDFNVRY